MRVSSLLCMVALALAPVRPTLLMACQTAFTEAASCCCARAEASDEGCCSSGPVAEDSVESSACACAPAAPEPQHEPIVCEAPPPAREKAPTVLQPDALVLTLCDLTLDPLAMDAPRDDPAYGDLSPPRSVSLRILHQSLLC